MIEGKLDRERNESGRGSRLVWGIIGALVVVCMGAPPVAHGQAAAEYGGAAGVAAATVASKPQIFRPGGQGRPNSSIFLATTIGPTPEQQNRAWFSKQAGTKGGDLTIEATPPKSRVWVDGKFVGEAPLSLTLPAGKHKLSLMGPRQEHADRAVEVASRAKERVEIQLPEVYPTAVAIRVFGDQPH